MMKVKTLQRSLLYAALGLFAVHLCGFAYIHNTTQYPSKYGLLSRFFGLNIFAYFAMGNIFDGAVFLLAYLGKLQFVAILFAKRKKWIIKFILYYTPLAIIAIGIVAQVYTGIGLDNIACMLAFFPLWMYAAIMRNLEQHIPTSETWDRQLCNFALQFSLLDMAFMFFVAFTFLPVMPSFIGGGALHSLFLLLKLPPP